MQVELSPEEHNHKRQTHVLDLKQWKKRHPVMTQEASDLSEVLFLILFPTTKSVTDGWATWSNFLPYSTLPVKSVYVRSRKQCRLSKKLFPSQDNYLITFPLGVAANMLSYKVGFKFPLLQALHRSM